MSRIFVVLEESVDMDIDEEDEIEGLKEDDHSVDQELVQKMLRDPDAFNEKYKGFAHFDPVTMKLGLVFGQLKPRKL